MRLGLYKWCLLLLLMAGGGQLLAASPVVDLRAHKAEKPMQLDEGWQWVWQALVPPDSLSAYDWEAVDFPVLWGEQRYKGQQSTPKGYATYVLRLLLPADQTTLGLYVPDVYTSHRLFVNGQLLAQNGMPGTDAQRTKPFWHGQVVQLPATSDTVVLVLHIANFHHSKGGPYKAVVLQSYDTLRNAHKRDSALDLVMTGALLMGGLFFFGLYLFGRYDRAMLFFALYCLAYSYRPVGSRMYVLHDMFPALHWMIAIRLEYFSLFAAIGFFAFYTLFLFPKDATKRVIYPLGFSCFALALTAIFLPPFYFTQALTPFLILMFAVVGYTTAVYLRAVRYKRTGSKYALASTVVIMIVMVLINMEYFQLLLPSSFVLFFGYFTFLFLQSLVLAFRFSYLLDQARKEAIQGLRIKTEFLSTMSHEIRTPLNAVMGMTHLLLKSKPRSDQEEQLGVLLFSARNLLSIVNDILDFNKIEAGKISLESIPIDLGLICRNIAFGLSSQANEKGVDIRLQIDPAVDRKLMGDPTRITQVISNLLANAIKFTKKGWVELRVRKLQRNAGTMNIRVEIEDTGIGIAADKLELIFDRFTQADSTTSRSFGGTGLGLSIVRRILELHKSKVLVKSELGKGSIFYFDISLPVTDELVDQRSSERELMTKELEPEPAQELLHGAEVLLVEDNALNIKVAVSFLQRWGASVEVAVNGQEALEKLDSSRHHLVLMDLHMPILDGYAATRALRARGEVLPIIALTASLPKEVEGDAFQAGLDAVVVKPFSPEELRKTIWQQLQRTPWKGKQAGNQAGK